MRGKQEIAVTKHALKKKKYYTLPTMPWEKEGIRKNYYNHIN